QRGGDRHTLGHTTQYVLPQSLQHLVLGLRELRATKAVLAPSAHLPFGRARRPRRETPLSLVHENGVSLPCETTAPLARRAAVRTPLPNMHMFATIAQEEVVKMRLVPMTSRLEGLVASPVMWKKRDGAFFRLMKCTTSRPPLAGGHRRSARWARVSGKLRE